MADSSFGPVVTVSATYGAGGSVLAPALAEALGLPFIDRLISADLSQGASAHVHSQESLVEGEQAPSPAGRILSYFARAASVGTMVVAPDPNIDDDETIRNRVEQALHQVRNGAPAVVLGRAGAVVLSRRPRSLHVRLDGPVDKRVAWAAAHEGLDTDAARRRQDEADRARALFVKRLYRSDPADARLYHLVIDATAFGIDGTLELLSGAARRFFEANP